MAEKRKLKIIDRDFVIANLDYEPATGDFLWKSCRARRTDLVGKKAGFVNATGYIQIGLGVTHYLAHRLAFLIMEGTLPEFDVDHINGNRQDNRFVNLRRALRTENSRNQKVRSTNKSGVMGVYWVALRNRWEVMIGSGDRNASANVFLGRYKDFFEAVCVRKSAELNRGFHVNHGRAA